jgi:hypothetical protein
MLGDVTVIGGGWSVRDLRPYLDRVPGTIIAVNDSAIYAPRWDYAVSMDRLWAEHRIADLAARVHAAEDLVQVHIRRNALQNLDAWKVNAWLHAFECDHRTVTFAPLESWHVLNGNNSGVCALNLAWKLRPRRLFMLGFDMNRNARGEAYWYPPYPWSSAAGSTSDAKYDRWAGDFETIAEQFDKIGTRVFNVSPASAIDNFQIWTQEQFARECK